MLKNQSTKKITILLASVIFVCSLALAFNTIPLVKKSPSSLSAQKSEDVTLGKKWYQRINQVGGKIAYSEFKNESENNLPEKQHRRAHIFGEALYKKEGIDGIRACDSSFNSGCYHSLIGLAIQYQGIKIIPPLMEKCTKNVFEDEINCLHGVGHGILSSFGYNISHLQKTLEICRRLSNEDLAGGCYNGAFMEYNFQTMLLKEGQKRQYDFNNPYYPCRDIDSYFLDYCMFQQSQWWLGVINGKLPERIKTIDTLCVNFTDESAQNLCYKGLGFQILSYSQYSTNTAKIFCKSLSSRKAELLCNSGVTIFIRVTPNLSNNINEFCHDSSYSPTEQEFCKLQTTQS